MKILDFREHSIKHFIPVEIINTNANLEDVQLKLILCFDTFRHLINRRVGLIKNGLTTGAHKSKEHPDGMAGDCFLYPEDGTVHIKKVYYAALEAGFKGIGIYYNKESKMYSFHLDIGIEYRCWIGAKEIYKDSWNYFDLIVDPKTLF